MLAAGPGWVILGAAKQLKGSFFASLAFSHGTPLDHANEPIEMYIAGYHYILPGFAALTVATFFVTLSQIKINVTNADAGSIAWSNFFSRLTRSHPGRVVWVVFNVAIALLLMEIGLFAAIERILALFSVLASAWVGALVSDLVVTKPFGPAPRGFAFNRAHLYDLNPVGVGAMALSVATGPAAHLGMFGVLAKAAAPFVALLLAFTAAPVIARATGGRFYLARRPRRNWETAAAGRGCVVCSNVFEPQDTAFCPAYGGVICSLCCSLDARWHDACKPHGRTSAQLRAAIGRLIPAPLRRYADGPLPSFLCNFACATGAIGLILLAIYLQAASGNPAGQALLANALWRAFFVRMIIAGIAAWLLVLAQETRAAAQSELRRQTALLLAEIAAPPAHRRQSAKGERSRRGRQSGEKPLRCRRQPRIAHAAERGAGICADPRPGPGDPAAPPRSHPHHPPQRRAYGRADRRPA